MSLLGDHYIQPLIMQICMSLAYVESWRYEQKYTCMVATQVSRKHNEALLGSLAGKFLCAAAAYT